MRTANYKTLTKLWHREIDKQFFCPKSDLDFVASIDTIRYDNILACDSMEFDFDMGRDLWLTKSRFTVLQRDYLDLAMLDSFLKRCKEIGLDASKRGVVTQMFAKQHKMSEKKYKWGNCMLGWDYRGGGRHGQPTLTMHSRVSYIAYIGGLDLALCWVLAREIGDRIGCAPEEFAFRWYLGSSQFHGFKSMPALFQHDGIEDVIVNGEDRFPSDEYPTIRMVRRWWKDAAWKYEMGVPLDDEKYGPVRRIRRRYEEWQRGDYLDSVPVSELSLAPLYARG